MNVAKFFFQIWNPATLSLLNSLDTSNNWICFVCVLTVENRQGSHHLMPRRAMRCQFHQHFTRGFFGTNVLCQAFLYLHFRFKLFFAKEYWRKWAHKMLAKLTSKGYTNYIRVNKVRMKFKENEQFWKHF